MAESLERFAVEEEQEIRFAESKQKKRLDRSLIEMKERLDRSLIEIRERFDRSQTELKK